jgi:hypothetical protein
MTMGVDYHVYVGPYITCKQRHATRDGARFGCINTACSKYRTKADKRTKFCPTCGQENGSFVVKVKVREDPYEVTGGALDRADSEAYGGGDDGRVIVTPNKSKGAPREFSFDPNCDTGETEIGEGAREREMAWFSEAFRGEIAKLSASFDDVTIRWGLLLYAT